MQNLVALIINIEQIKVIERVRGIYRKITTTHGTGTNRVCCSMKGTFLRSSLIGTESYLNSPTMGPLSHIGSIFILGLGTSKGRKTI